MQNSDSQIPKTNMIPKGGKGEEQNRSMGLRDTSYYV